MDTVIIASTAIVNKRTGEPVQRGKRMAADEAQAHVVENFGQAVWESLTEVETESGNHFWSDGIFGGQWIRLHTQRG